MESVEYVRQKGDGDKKDWSLVYLYVRHHINLHGVSTLWLVREISCGLLEGRFGQPKELLLYGFGGVFDGDDKVNILSC